MIIISLFVYLIPLPYLTSSLTYHCLICLILYHCLIWHPDDHRIITTTSTPPPVPTAVVAAALVVVTMMIMIVVILIVVLKKRQKQVERDYKIPPPNTELQESIMLKNNAAK